jgi:hypothetical protein
MDMDRMDELARDPKFIPGIYNYCDAWCKRCAFTSRCMNYAIAQEEETGRPSARDSENEAFWDTLHETFETTRDRIEEEAEEAGFDLGEEDFDEFLDEQETVRETARSQPYSRTAMRYRDVVDEWFKLNGELLRDKGGDPESLDQADVPAVELSGDAAALHDCLEVIRWYQLQIWVKLCRAASGTLRAEIDGLEGLQEDADGSAKVAILGIERSIAAWVTVLKYFPDHEDAIFSRITLQRLLRQVEAAFPNARAFRRPGFDTED